jgi:hypothetical protein
MKEDLELEELKIHPEPPAEVLAAEDEVEDITKNSTNHNTTSYNGLKETQQLNPGSENDSISTAALHFPK